MAKRQSRHSNLGFVDLLFNTLIGYVFLFIVAFLLINPVAKDKTVDMRAEMVITVAWPDSTPGNPADDVDVWLEDPSGNKMFFGNKTPAGSGLSLLRDDLGLSNDRIKLPSGEIVDFNENREFVSIRKAIEGEYVLNVHMYSKRSGVETPVTVEVTKLSPYGTVVLKTVTLTKRGEEVTISRFTIDKDGKVESTNDLFKNLVNSNAPRSSVSQFGTGPTTGSIGSAGGG